MRLEFYLTPLGGLFSRSCGLQARLNHAIANNLYVGLVYRKEGEEGRDEDLEEQHALLHGGSSSGSSPANRG